MSKSIEKQIGNRFNLVRELLLLTVKEVNSITKIPVTMLRRIENGLFPSSSEYTDRLCYLYQIDKADLYNLSKPMPDWKTLRRRVLAKHKINLRIIQALNKKPRPKKAIQYRVLKSSFLNNFKTTELIIKHLIARYNWTYSYPGILVALDSLVEDKLIETKAKNIRPQEYRKARNISDVEEEVIEQISIQLEENTPQDIKDLYTPAYTKAAEMLYFLKDGSKKRSEIFAVVNYRNLAKNHNRSLKVLNKLNLVEMTIKDKPNSSLQMYRLTQEGLELIDKFTAK